MPDLKLGLIGDNISCSKAPLLHQLAGKLTGLDVRYDRLVPKDLGRDFDGVFEDCIREGYRGINVTYPYKERVVPEGSDRRSPGARPHGGQHHGLCPRRPDRPQH